MRKLKLNLEDLDITSFEADSSAAPSRGTVNGASDDGKVPIATAVRCPTVASCDATGCYNGWDTCGQTCECIAGTTTIDHVICP